ncbi:MAG: DUF2997 domain-containing protein [Deltaproteobacteria bacterium]|nr:DUF2997 domain-containing protein [Deltaproteobacteria bacterium]
MSRIDIKIYPDGRVDLNLSDFAGMSCLDTTRSIENLLGSQIISRNLASDYRELERSDNQRSSWLKPE